MGFITSSSQYQVLVPWLQASISDLVVVLYVVGDPNVISELLLVVIAAAAIVVAEGRNAPEYTSDLVSP